MVLCVALLYLDWPNTTVTFNRNTLTSVLLYSTLYTLFEKGFLVDRTLSRCQFPKTPQGGHTAGVCLPNLGKEFVC